MNQAMLVLDLNNKERVLANWNNSLDEKYFQTFSQNMTYSTYKFYSKSLMKSNFIKLIYDDIKSANNDQKIKIDKHFDDMVRRGLILIVGKGTKCYKL